MSIISYGALVLPSLTGPESISLQAGDVSPSDFQAPEDKEYISEVRTEEARLAAENAVAPVYALPDPTIARKQLERLRAALQYITLVRDDLNASTGQKASDIASTQRDRHQAGDRRTDPRTDLRPLGHDPAGVFERVGTGDAPHHSGHRSGSRPKERSSLVSLALNEEQAAVVVELVSAFVTPNSVYSAELTESAKGSAREAVEPVIQRYKAGEIIVLRGQVIRPAQLEVLQKLGLIEQTSPWQEYAGAGALVLMLAGLTALYFTRRRLVFLFDARSLVIVALIFLVFVVGARIIIPDRTVLPYAYPLAAVGLLVATLFGLEAGIILSILISLLVPYGMPNALDLTPYFLFHPWPACSCWERRAVCGRSSARAWELPSRGSLCWRRSACPFPLWTGLPFSNSQARRSSADWLPRASPCCCNISLRKRSG
ncbi:MAG: hypothetical protein M0C28_34880 [Candidatus Moduliflexus flocculans]|nr:hypothetical protein [Candidatus Moduliflexus flocculans]